MSPLLARVEYLRAELDALSDKLDDLSQQIREMEAQPPQRATSVFNIVMRLVGRAER